MGFLARVPEDLFLGSGNGSKVLPKGPGWGFRPKVAREQKVPKFVIFGTFAVKFGT